MTYALTNVGNVPIDSLDYTSTGVQNAYMTNMQTILTQITAPDQSNPNDPSDGYDAVLQAVQALQDLAKNGEIDPSTGATYYMSVGMLNNVNFAINLLQNSGISTASPLTDSPSQTAVMQVLRGGGAANNDQAIGILATAVTDPSITTSDINLQTLIQTEYVTRANNQISSELSSLEGALQMTNSILNVLQSLQNISSHVAISAIPTNVTLTGGLQTLRTLSGYLNTYKQIASAYFADRLPTPAVQAGDGEAILTAYKELTTYITALSTLNGGTDGPQYANTLGYYLQQVKAGISTAFFIGKEYSSFVSANAQYFAAGWILNAEDPGGDANSAAVLAARSSQSYYNGTSPYTAPGAIQNNLTASINSAQTLNGQQQLDVQNFEFVFQQYFQSASTALQTTTTIIGTMAQNAGQP